MVILFTFDDFLQEGAQVISGEGYGNRDHFALARRIGFGIFENAGADGAYLGAEVRAHDVSHDISIHRRTRPDDETLFCISRELGHVSGDAADKLSCQAGSQVASESGSAENDGIRFLLQEERSQRLLVRFAIVVGQQRVVDHVDLVSAQSDERRRVIGEAAPYEYHCHFFLQLISQDSGFTGELAGDLLNLAIHESANDINSFVIRKIHFRPPYMTFNFCIAPKRSSAASSADLPSMRRFSFFGGTIGRT